MATSRFRLVSVAVHSSHAAFAEFAGDAGVGDEWWHSAASPQTRMVQTVRPGQTGQTVVFLGFCPWQGRRRKPIVCPTLE